MTDEQERYDPMASIKKEREKHKNDTKEDVLAAVERLRSTIEGNAKTIADYGPYSFKKLYTKELKRELDQLKKCAEKEDWWNFGYHLELLHDEVENIDEGGDLGLMDSSYYNDVEILDSVMSIRAGIHKDDGNWTPEFQAKYDADPSYRDAKYY